MQLLEEVYFILEWLYFPLQVQSGEGSIVHVLRETLILNKVTYEGNMNNA